VAGGTRLRRVLLRCTLRRLPLFEPLNDVELDRVAGLD
jgi:hypothetical protein